MSAKKVNGEEFNKIIEKGDIVLADFFATWCGPCRMMAPVIEKLADDYKNKIEIVEIDIDENPDLAAKYNVMSVPTFIIFKDKEPVETMIGARAKDGIAEKIEELLEGRK